MMSKHDNSSLGWHRNQFEKYIPYYCIEKVWNFDSIILK